MSKSLYSVFDQILAKRQSAALPYVHCVSALTGEGLQAFKQSIAEIVSFDEKICESVEPMSTVDDPATPLDDDSDEQEVLLSEHDIRVFKALEANMREEEEEDKTNRPTKTKQ